MTKNALSRSARVYVCSIAAIGVCAIGQSVFALYTSTISWNWFILAILTLVSGSATVKLPSVPATISISETFVFTSVLLFGPAAGTLTVALDALVISLWLARKGHPFYRLAFNICALPASLWIAAHIFYSIWSTGPLSKVGSPIEMSMLLLPLLIFTITYYLLNSWLIAFAISLEKHLSPFSIWKHNFAWLSLNYFGGASVAALLVAYTRNIDYTYIAFVLPLLAVLYFTFSMSMGRVADANKHLTELNALYMSTIETLAMAIDAKDQITHGHIRRVQHYATGLAHAIGVKDSNQIKAIEAASLLHDMGKLAVPEYILNKPGALTPAEFEKMKLHSSVGADILSAIDFPYPVVPIVRHHHESWDGTGYPDRLKGSQIPIGARILAVVDCFDALTSDRPYRPRLSDAEALRILAERRGSMYDPLIVDAFVRVYRDISPDSREEDFNGLEKSETRWSALPRRSEGFHSGPFDGITSSSEETIALYELARALTGQLDLPQIAKIVCTHTRRVIPASTYVFYAHDEDSDDLYTVIAAGDNADLFTGVRIQRGQRLSGWVAANGRTILNSDPVLDLGESARTMRPRLKSCLSTNLRRENGLLGVLTLYAAQHNAFTEDHRRVIEAISRQVSDAVTRTTGRDLAQKLAEAESGSHLRGFPTGKQLQRFLEAELSARNGKSSVSLLFVSLRPAAPANGTTLSAQGRVLEAIKGSMRVGDVLFQYGEGELVILLDRVETFEATSIAVEISNRVSKAMAPEHSHDRISTIAVGIATAPRDGTTVEQLAAAASRGQSRKSSPPLPESIH